MEKSIPQAIFKFCGFFIIANLPFLTISQFLGIDTFIDSFEHPNYFYYIKNEKIPSIDPHEGYVILEKPTYQGFSIEEGDTILYYTIKNTLQQKIVYQIRSDDGVKTYYTSTSNTDNLDAPIYEHQIIGKIRGRFEDNIWNAFCLQVWDLSIDNLNALALFTHQ
jgi:hypothetical protein